MRQLPTILFAAWQMALDTFRQAWWSGLTPFALAAITAAMLFCFSLGIVGESATLETKPWEERHWLPRAVAEQVGPDNARAEGADVPTGLLSVAFGKVQIALPRDGRDSVRFVLVCLAGLIADSAGILLLLVWTAGLIPQFLEPQSAAVLLCKPALRGALLCGKYAGVACYVTILAMAFVGATWLAAGISTGVWSESYWSAVPVLGMHFAAFYAVSCWIGVASRSATAAAVGTVLTWVGCWIGSAACAADPMLARYADYLPSPGAFTALLIQRLDAESNVAMPPAASGYGVLASGGMAIGALLLATLSLKRRDY